MYAWTSWRTIVPLVIGAVGLLGFVFWEVYGAAEPLIPLSIFGNRSASIAYFIDVSSATPLVDAADLGNR